VKMVTRDAQEAMKKLESNCSLVVPQTVSQLAFESVRLEAKVGDDSTRKTLPLEAVRRNLAERGGFCPATENKPLTSIDPDFSIKNGAILEQKCNQECNHHGKQNLKHSYTPIGI
jgi:hypothetical protein